MRNEPEYLDAKIDRANLAAIVKPTNTISAGAYQDDLAFLENGTATTNGKSAIYVPYLEGTGDLQTIQIPQKSARSVAKQFPKRKPVHVQCGPHDAAATQSGVHFYSDDGNTTSKTEQNDASRPFPSIGHLRPSRDMDSIATVILDSRYLAEIAKAFELMADLRAPAGAQSPFAVTIQVFSDRAAVEITSEHVPDAYALIMPITPGKAQHA